MASSMTMRTVCTNLSTEFAPIAGSYGTNQKTVSKLTLKSTFHGVYQSRKVSQQFGVAQGGARLTAWFKFGKNGLDAEGAGIYGSQGREDFDRDDVEQYFNYMGMLAAEGSYDKMEALLDTGIHPVDILLLLAASEGDRPKIQELLRAGANASVKDGEGRTALDRAVDDEIRTLIQGGAEARV